MSSGSSIFIRYRQGNIIVTIVCKGMSNILTADGVSIVTEVPTVGERVFGSWVGSSSSKFDCFTLFDGGGSGGSTAIFVGDGESDVIVAVIGIGMGGVLPDNRVGTIAEIPGVGEIGTTTAVFCCGCEGNILAFSNGGGDDDTVDRRSDVVDGNINGGGIGGLTITIEAEISKAICTDVIAAGRVSYLAITWISGGRLQRNR